MKTTHLSDETLLLLIDGELPSTRATEAEQHLEVCAACHNRHEALQALSADIAHLEPEPIASESARASLALQLASATQSRWPAWLRPRLLLQAAMVLALGITAFALRQSYGPLQDQMAAYEDAGPEPNRAITPGAVRTTDLSELCAMADDDLDPTVSPEKEREVFAAYGVNERAAQLYQVDYLINPQLGGDSTLENLWPEPYHATVWNAKAKDALETRLHGMVCSGQIGLEDAQHELAADWIGTYKKVFHADRPVSVQAEMDLPPLP